MDSSFTFGIAQEVVIAASGEAGTVIGRAEYINAGPTYLVRYRAADGRATEQWWNQDALSSAPTAARSPE